MNKNLTKISYLFIGVVVALGCNACADLLETDSPSVTFEEDNRLDSPNDSIYSVLGILSQWQALGERYVILGELRGDLMKTTSNALSDLQEIANFEVTDDNEFLDKSGYYNVINNCNYALQKMDTTLASNQEKYMLPEYVAIKAIRAWTYWQLALTFGEVKWLEKPIMGLDEALRSYPVKNIDETAELLIEDLLPYSKVRELDYGTIDHFSSRQMFVPVNMMLGDLYLYQNEYVKAAEQYYLLISRRQLTLTATYASTWQDEKRLLAYMQQVEGYKNEMVSGMVYSSDARESHPRLIRFTCHENPALVPAETFVTRMEKASHVFATKGAVTAKEIKGYFEGDLRGKGVSAYGVNFSGAYGYMDLGKGESLLITKYYHAREDNYSGYDPENEAIDHLAYTRAVPLCRTAHVYLRYAEALNRSGKPSMAFAVLKYGLNGKTLGNASRINPAELTGEPYLDFSSSVYNNNIGTANRGCGWGISLDENFYVIPNYTRYDSLQNAETGVVEWLPSTNPADWTQALQDSIVCVENYILDEMAAETSFEGNRFFDLLRIARHRHEYPQFLAEKIAARFEHSEEMKNKLVASQGWFYRQTH